MSDGITVYPRGGGSLGLVSPPMCKLASFFPTTQVDSRTADGAEKKMALLSILPSIVHICNEQCAYPEIEREKERFDLE